MPAVSTTSPSALRLGLRGARTVKYNGTKEYIHCEVGLHYNTLQKRIYINNHIRAKEVRLIDETGKQLGVVPFEQALSLATERGYDLIQVTERLDPPVCKLGEYGKYLYQQGKKAKDVKKQDSGELKEIRLTYAMSDHDLETRAKQTEKFLQKGNRVRVTLRLKGRQNALEGYAREKMNKFLTVLQNSVELKTEREIKKEPRGLSTIVTKK